MAASRLTAVIFSTLIVSGAFRSINQCGRAARADINRRNLEGSLYHFWYLIADVVSEAIPLAPELCIGGIHQTSFILDWVSYVLCGEQGTIEVNEGAELAKDKARRHGKR